MDEEQIRKAYAAALDLTNNPNSQVAEAARTLCEQLAQTAKQSGINLDTTPVIASRASLLAAADTFQIDLNRVLLGISPSVENAARQLMAASPDGSISVSLKAITDTHKARRDPSAAGRRFGA